MNEDFIFPTNGDDVTEILYDYQVVDIPENPKFTPYIDTITGENVSPLTDFMYYRKLPEFYRQFDSPLGKPLYRFLQSMYESGYAVIVDSNDKKLRGIDGLLNLVDPEKCPEEYLPYYCKSLGIPWFPDLITENAPQGRDKYYYIRTFLCNIGEIYKRRGTESVVLYIAKMLTEMEVKLKYQRVLLPDGTTKARILWVDVQARDEEELRNVTFNANIVKRFIDTQIPYYITSVVVYSLKRDINFGKYHAFCSTKVVKQAIIPEPIDFTNL